jgi:iron complex outermembrane recepter protein
MSTISNRKSMFRAALAVSASFGALCVGGTALAQDAAKPADEATTGDIVVTAQFRTQKLQDTPLSITAVNAATLEARSQTSLSEVAAQAPNVVLVPGGAVFGPALGAQIRGIGQFDFNPAYEPGVGVYVDDVYFPTLTGSVFDLLDLDRVEILRGPQGTLTGRNSIGGAIKLFSKKPTGDGSGYVEATYGSRNRLGLRASADIKLADNLFARISGVRKEQKGFVDQIDYGCARPGNVEGIAATRTPGNCVVDKLGGEGYTAVRAQVRYAGEKAEVIIAADYTAIDHTNPGEVLTLSSNANFICGISCTYASFGGGSNGFVTGLGPPPQPAAAATVQSNRYKFDGWGVSGTVNLDLTDSLKLSSITAFRRYSSEWGTDDDFTPVQAAGGSNRLRHRFFSQELRLNGSIGDMVDWTIGGYYSKQQTTYYTQQDIRYIIPGYALQFYGDDPVNADSKAAFATVIVRPAEGLTFTGGLRYTGESKDYQFLRRNYNGTVNTFLDPANTLNGFIAKFAGNKLDYRASVDYRFSPAVLAYATISTGFKGGGVTARPFNVFQAQQGSFTPETVTAFEVGLKTDFFDRRARLNLAAFLNKYKNVQLPFGDCSFINVGTAAVPVKDTAPCGVVGNAGDSTLKGFEAELTLTPVDGLNIDGSLSYISGKWNRVDPRVGAAVTIADPATSAPEWKWSLGIQYKAELGGSGSITPRFDIAYTGARFSGRPQISFAAARVPTFQASYTVANGRVTWENEPKDLTVSLEVTNLFNKYYYISTFNAVTAFSGTAYSQIGHPREWAVSIKKKF